MSATTAKRPSLGGVLPTARRGLVLAILLGVMLGTNALKTEGLAGADPLMLAAIGFVLLAAFTISELGNALSLPRVTGYILAGLALGPSAGNILSAEVVREMRVVNALALGLIAVGAGLELDLGQLRKVWKTLVATTAVKMVLAVPLIGAVVLGVQVTLAPLPLASSGEVFAAVIVLAVLFVGTSPSITLAVLSETGAKGRLTDLVLGAAVLKDLVLVISLAIAVAVARTLIAPSASLDASILWHVAAELGSSVLAGAVLGALLILYIRFVHAEMLLFVALMIIAVSELGQALHLELLLVFITAGFVVRNFSKHEHELSEPVSTVALPVFVVFFTNAGASVDLPTTWRILPLAAAISVARAAAFFVAGRVGGALGREGELIRQQAWLGYLPLAGVTLGLVGLTAQRLPELRHQILTSGMAVVGINLLIGPIAQRRALAKAGEIPGVRATTGEPEAAAPAPRLSAFEASAAAPERLDLEEALARATAGLSSAELREIATKLFRHLDEAIDDFRRRNFEPWAESMRHAAQAILESEGGPAEAPLLAEFSQRPLGDEITRRGEECRRLFDELRGALGAVPETASVPMEDENWCAMPGDGAGLRWKKRAARLGRVLRLRRGRPARRPPARLLAAVALEPSAAAVAGQVLSSWSRAQADVLDAFRLHVSDARSEEATAEAVEAALGRWRERVEDDARRTLLLGLESFSKLLARADGPALPLAEIRYSRVEPRVREALARLGEDVRLWASRLEALQSSLRLAVALDGLETQVRRSLGEDVLVPMTSAVDALGPLLAELRAQVVALAERARGGELGEGELSALQRGFREAQAGPVMQQLEAVGSHFRASTSIHAVSMDLRRAVEALPERIVIVVDEDAARRADRPDDVLTRAVLLRELARERLLRGLQSDLDEHARDASAFIAGIGGRARAALDAVAQALEAGLDPSAGTEVAASEIAGRCVEQIGKLEVDAVEVVGRAREQIGVRVLGALTELHAAATGSSGPAASGKGGDGQGWLAALGRLAAPLGRRLAVALRSEADLGAGGGSAELGLRVSGPGAPFDASEIRAYARRSAPIAVPDAYASFFELEPVREHRLFTANRDELASLLLTEREWLQGGPGSALVVGPHGSGRTSVLNLCEFEMSSPRVVRPEPVGLRRDTGVVAALAYELGCRPTERAVTVALRRTRTAVLLDDLEQWFGVDAGGFADLERFLELVVRTRSSVFWLVSVSDAALALYEEALAVRPAFGRVANLRPLAWQALAQTIEVRHQQSGLELSFRKNVASKLLGRLVGLDERAMFFRVLARASEGNLARALCLWLGAASVETLEERKVLRPRPARAVARGLPFLGQLPACEIAMLAELSRFGPLTLERLGVALALPRPEAERHASFLVAAGLVETLSSDAGPLRIPEALRGPVQQGLREIGAWR